MIDRLLVTALSEWPRFDGWCAARGVDPVALPPPRLASLVYHWLTGHLDRDKREEVDAQLWQPPPDRHPDAPDPAGPWSADAEMRDFTALMADG